MKNYEAKKPSYFATPSPQLIHALNTALKQILAAPLAERFAKHVEASDRIKKAISDLGLKQVAAKPEDQAHTMTAIYLPETVKAAEILPALAKRNVVFAGGIHKEIAPTYIRFGHMGVSVVSQLFLMFQKHFLTLVVSLMGRGVILIGQSRHWKMVYPRLGTRRHKGNCSPIAKGKRGTRLTTRRQNLQIRQK